MTRTHSLKSRNEKVEALLVNESAHAHQPLALRVGRQAETGTGAAILDQRNRVINDGSFVLRYPPEATVHTCAYADHFRRPPVSKIAHYLPNFAKGSHSGVDMFD